MNRPEYNDNTLPIDEALYQRMREHGECFVVSFSSCIHQAWTQESMNYFPSTLRTYLFVILLLYFPSSSIKTTVRAQTILRSVSCLFCFMFGQALTTPRAEHPIDQLADSEIQTAASKVAHRLARRVPQHGSSNDRL
jgi:hypothetical protein